MKNKCLICGNEWESIRKGKYCSSNCWNKAHRERMKELSNRWNKAHRERMKEHRYNFYLKKGGYNAYYNPHKKWIGTVICDKCGKKGRAYIYFRNHCTNQYLHVMHFKGKNKSYDYDCYLGVCDEKGNLKLKRGGKR